LKQAAQHWLCGFWRHHEDVYHRNRRWAIGWHSPAPPIVALVGLLGILVGEQIPPLVKKMISEQTVSLSVIKETCANHMFGALPERHGETDKNDQNPPKTVG